MHTTVLRRLWNQQMLGSRCQTPEQVVAWLGAVQAQEYYSAQWALKLRLPAATAAQIDQAFNAGRILRTHVLRPTWHFVASADLRWMLNLTGGRVKAGLASYDRRLEIDANLLRRAYAVIEKALAGGQQLTRQELAVVLGQAGIAAAGQRLAHMIMAAEVDCLICSGPLRGKQFTYMLFDERVPPAPVLAREEALAELARRFFTSHGPAQLKDFAWWSGLTQADGKAALANLDAAIQAEQAGEKTYYFSAAALPDRLPEPPLAYLLPNYDEMGIAYSDREDMLDPLRSREWLFSFVNGYLLVDGRVEGLWKRRQNKQRVEIAIQAFRPFSTGERSAIEEGGLAYGAFLGKQVDFLWQT